MIEFELEALSSLQLFQLCAEHWDQGEYWEEFLRRYNQLLVSSVYQAYRRFAKAGLPPPWAVAEVLQDTYLKILKNDCLMLRRFRGHSDQEARAYLVQAVIKITISRLRREHAKKRWAEVIRLDDLLRQGEGEEGLTKLPSGYTGEISEPELVELLRRHFPDPQGRRDSLIFLLHVREGLRVSEIAAAGIFGVKADGIHNAIARVRTKLKNILSP